jgi:hypothetical protein
VPAAAAARILGGRVVFSEQRAGQWVAVIEMERQQEILNAALLWHVARTQESTCFREGRFLVSHQVAGVGFDHQPDFLAGH